ncbi:MAG: hypothetical protein O7C75_14960 [Verrucomicrobia bacterium]|nr:hypothetical protein [Verrucomicrobiota bacterium]
MTKRELGCLTPQEAVLLMYEVNFYSVKMEQVGNHKSRGKYPRRNPNASS